MAVKKEVTKPKKLAEASEVFILKDISAIQVILSNYVKVKNTSKIQTSEQSTKIHHPATTQKIIIRKKNTWV